MKRIDGVRQVKKHLRPPFNRHHAGEIIRYGDVLYDVKKGFFVDKAEACFLIPNCGLRFGSRFVHITYKRRETIADDFLSETYTLSTFPNRKIERHGYQLKKEQ